MAYKISKRITNMFNDFSPKDVFTSFILFDLTFQKNEERSKRNRKKVSNFIQQRKETGHILKLDSKDEETKLYNYQKIKSVATPVVKSRKGCEKYFYLMLPFWNKLSYGIWVTCRDFSNYISLNSTFSFTPSQISKFLKEMSFHKFAGFQKVGPKNSYRKLHPVTKKEMEDNFMIHRTVIEEENPIEAKPMIEVPIEKETKDNPYSLSLQEVYNSIKEVKKEVQDLSNITKELKNELSGLQTISISALIKTT